MAEKNITKTIYDLREFLYGPEYVANENAYGNRHEHEPFYESGISGQYREEIESY
jgi:hypothetical protein